MGRRLSQSGVQGRGDLELPSLRVATQSWVTEVGCHGCIYEEGEQRRARRGTRREGRPLGTESAVWMEVAFAGQRQHAG